MEPRLYQNLRSFCLQDYAAFQLLFGVRDKADPALTVARRLQGEFPELDITVVVDARVYGRNYKVSTLINLSHYARYPWLVIADSDISVGRDYLQRVCAPLVQHRIGTVTCLYRGRPVAGLCSRLGAMFIDEWFVPAAYIALSLGSHAFGFGATIALRRTTLDAIGGFQSIADELADDYRLAEQTRSIGFATELSNYIVTTDVTETSVRQLAMHELRRMRTIRVLSPFGYSGMFISFGLTVAALGAALAGGRTHALMLLAATCVARAILHFAVTPHTRHWYWRAICTLPLVALRDVANVALWAAAFAGRRVIWAGYQLRPHKLDPL